MHGSRPGARARRARRALREFRVDGVATTIAVPPLAARSDRVRRRQTHHGIPGRPATDHTHPTGGNDMTTPAIITVAITGAVPTTRDNPAVPVVPERQVGVGDRGVRGGRHGLPCPCARCRGEAGFRPRAVRRGATRRAARPAQRWSCRCRPARAAGRSRSASPVSSCVRRWRRSRPDR